MQSVYCCLACYDVTFILPVSEPVTLFAMVCHKKWLFDLYPIFSSLSLFLLIFFVCVCFGSIQAKGQIGAIATGLHHNHSNVGSELNLRPTPQLTAAPDP